MAQTTTNQAETLSNDEAFVIVFGAGGKDAKGYATGSAGSVAAPTIAIQDANGNPDTSNVLVGFDTAAKTATLYISRAPATSDTEPAAYSGQAVSTFPDGTVEINPYTFDPGVGVGESESDSVVGLDDVPSTVTFAPPAAAATPVPAAPASNLSSSSSSAGGGSSSTVS